jgi:hypothetical protein
VDSITVTSRHDFRPGQRIGIGPRPRWHDRIWRWLTKRNYRIVRIDGETLTIERCR